MKKLMYFLVVPVFLLFIGCQEDPYEEINKEEPEQEQKTEFSLTAEPKETRTGEEIEFSISPFSEGEELFLDMGKDTLSVNKNNVTYSYQNEGEHEVILFNKEEKFDSVEVTISQRNFSLNANPEKAEIGEEIEFSISPFPSEGIFLDTGEDTILVEGSQKNYKYQSEGDYQATLYKKKEEFDSVAINIYKGIYIAEEKNLKGEKKEFKIALPKGRADTSSISDNYGWGYQSNIDWEIKSVDKETNTHVFVSMEVIVPYTLEIGYFKGPINDSAPEEGVWAVPKDSNNENWNSEQGLWEISLK